MKNWAAKKRAEPYYKIGGELSEMRKDTLMLIQHSIKQAKKAYVLVNRKLGPDLVLCVRHRMGSGKSV